jgi:spore coat polysaccharide biosynthesis protein SpsF (cytidylyltransferase family)
MFSASQTPITAILQARMGSARLPGKVLRCIRGKPVIAFLVERLQQSNVIASVIIATSSERPDDAIALWCEENGVHCFRGAESDVAGRFLPVAERFSLDSFIRLSADSPLLDVNIVERCIQRFVTARFDLVTNIMPRTFPRGQSVEILRTEALQRAYARMTEPDDFEHVTRYFYDHPTDFRISNVAADVSYPPLHLAIDTPQDLQLFERLVEAMDRPHWKYRLDDIVMLCSSLTAGASQLPR